MAVEVDMMVEVTVPRARSRRNWRRKLKRVDETAAGSPADGPE